MRILVMFALLFTLVACGVTEEGAPQEEQEQEAPAEEQQQEAPEAKEWTGVPWTIDDGPPWPLAEDAETINAEGTNHREVVTPRDFDFVQDRAEFWVENPARHAPEGSDLAARRAASRAQSEANGVECQVSYVKRQFGGNARLDGLMDRGVCWHYNEQVADERFTAATMRLPNGERGAMAWFDEEGRLRWLDRYGQTQPRFIDGEPFYWEDTITEEEG